MADFRKLKSLWLRSKDLLCSTRWQPKTPRDPTDIHNPIMRSKHRIKVKAESSRADGNSVDILTAYSVPAAHL